MMASHANFKMGSLRRGLRYLLIGLLSLCPTTISYAQDFSWLPLLVAEPVAFRSAIEIKINTQSISASTVSLGDFDADGNLDLALTRGAAGVAILKGDGDGYTFNLHQEISLGSGQGSLGFVAIGDFDNDKHLDLAVTNSAYNHIHVLLGIGDGTFRVPTNFPTTQRADSLAIADFNGDGNLDLVTRNSGVAPNPTGSVSILFGDGNGSFSPATDYAVGLHTSSVAAGDLNGDGKPDLAVAGSANDPQTGAMPPSKVAVLLAQNGGTFGASAYFDVGSGPQAVAIGDFNLDNIPDLATANSSYVTNVSNHLSVLLGTGAGTGSFDPAMHFAAGPNDAVTSVAVAIGDMDKDGRPDLISVNPTTSPDYRVSVLLGAATGLFIDAMGFNVPGLMSSLAIGNVNKDNRLDVVVAGHTGVFVLLNRKPWSYALIGVLYGGVVIVMGAAIVLIIRLRRR